MTPTDDKQIQIAPEAVRLVDDVETAALFHAEKSLAKRKQALLSYLATQQARIASLEGEKATLTEKLDVAREALKHVLNTTETGDEIEADIVQNALRRISGEG